MAQRARAAGALPHVRPLASSPEDARCSVLEDNCATIQQIYSILGCPLNHSDASKMEYFVDTVLFTIHI